MSGAFGSPSRTQTVRTDYYRMLTEHNESKGNHAAAKQSDTKAKLYASKDWYQAAGK
jgi:hypothetical protein